MSSTWLLSVQLSSEMEPDGILLFCFKLGNRYLRSFGWACRYLWIFGNSCGFSNLNLSSYSSEFSIWCLRLYSLYLSSASQSQPLSLQLHNSILFVLLPWLIPLLSYDSTPHDITSGKVLKDLLHTFEFPLLSDLYSLLLYSDSSSLSSSPSSDDSSEDTYTPSSNDSSEDAYATWSTLYVVVVVVVVVVTATITDVITLPTTLLLSLLLLLLLLLDDAYTLWSSS